MKIQVIGSGCHKCKSLYELTVKAVEELELKEEVEYVTDVTKIIELCVKTTPVIAINKKAIMKGSTKELKK